MSVSNFIVGEWLDSYSEHETLEDFLADPDVSYIEDTLSEWADSQVPVYTIDAVQEWLDLGCPDIDDPGLIEGVTDVTRIIQTILYERYINDAYTVAQEAGLI